MHSYSYLLAQQGLLQTIPIVVYGLEPTDNHERLCKLIFKICQGLYLFLNMLKNTIEQDPNGLNAALQEVTTCVNN